jgi:hypothetical protein
MDAIYKIRLDVHYEMYKITDMEFLRLDSILFQRLDQIHKIRSDGWYLG